MPVHLTVYLHAERQYIIFAKAPSNLYCLEFCRAKIRIARLYRGDPFPSLPPDYFGFFLGPVFSEGTWVFHHRAMIFLICIELFLLWVFYGTHFPNNPPCGSRGGCRRRRRRRFVRCRELPRAEWKRLCRFFHQWSPKCHSYADHRWPHQTFAAYP